ncbi:hypothetical protein F0562_022585 [Nyssa sinensis]|uniref:Uncharacterized protein n=1 Tax=Nyssa sinensis TaxID=561372 RepID=A0A5J5BPE3_9ASTE|nr:hypothetical protein F0562_022585 [Nyssa sinensis]
MYKAQSLHASLIKNGLLYNVYRCNLLLGSYIKFGAASDAHKLLHFIPHPNVVSYNTVLSGFFKSSLFTEALKIFDSAPKKDSQSWNIFISGCVQNQRLKEALTHFVKMRHSPIKPDNFTYSIVIPCCDFEFGQQVHGEVIKVGLDSDAFLGTNLLRMYSRVNDLNSARKVFDGMPRRDLVTWNALIACYSKYGMADASVELFQKLGREGILADEYTYAIVLNQFASCSQVFEAMQVHSLIIRNGFCSECYISNSLVNLYSKCGFVASAFLLFEEMPDQDVVSWTAIISGFSNSGHVKEAIWLFYKMQLAEVEPNSFTFGAVISMCSVSSALNKGKQFHGLILKFGLEADIVVGSAIVDVYSKCGGMDDALRVFRSMPERDIVSWNGIICGYAQNGETMEALKLYNEMMQSESSVITPNDVTFVGLLSACSHSEAEALMRAIPFKRDIVMRSALLGACKLHGNLQMARRIAEHLCIDEQWNSSNYVLLANSYTDIGGWCEALEVREVMDAREVQKVVGCSWVEIGSCMHSFISGDKLHPHIDAVCRTLQRLYLQTGGSYENELIFY